MSNESDEVAEGSMDAIRAALARKAPGPADTRTFKPAYVWQVIAAALPEIDRIVAASKGRGRGGAGKAVFDGIAESLRAPSGFDDISGESVRQYRSRILRGQYDAKLAALGFRRIGNRIEAPAELPQVEHLPRNDAPAAVRAPLASLPQRATPERAVRLPPPDDPSDDATPTRLR